MSQVERTCNFNPFPNKPWLLRVCSTCLLKNTVGKGEIARNKALQTGKNTVGKGEIARYEQFLFFPQCFQKTCTADT